MTQDLIRDLDRRAEVCRDNDDYVTARLLEDAAQAVAALDAERARARKYARMWKGRARALYHRLRQRQKAKKRERRDHARAAMEAAA